MYVGGKEGTLGRGGAPRQGKLETRQPWVKEFVVVRKLQVDQLAH